MCWLKSHLHSELESTILAIQDQVVAARLIEAKIMKKHLPSLMCRLCGESEETIAHLLTAYSSLVANEYLYQHNLVPGVIHWHLIKVYGLTVGSGSWLTHKPPPLIETAFMKILWDFGLSSIRSHPSNCPDIVLFDYSMKKIYFIEVSCPADVNVLSQKNEKLRKHGFQQVSVICSLLFLLSSSFWPLSYSGSKAIVMCYFCISAPQNSLITYIQVFKMRSLTVPHCWIISMLQNMSL